MIHIIRIILLYVYVQQAFWMKIIYRDDNSYNYIFLKNHIYNFFKIQFNNKILLFFLYFFSFLDFLIIEPFIQCFLKALSYY